MAAQIGALPATPVLASVGRRWGGAALGAVAEADVARRLGGEVADRVVAVAEREADRLGVGGADDRAVGVEAAAVERAVALDPDRLAVGHDRAAVGRLGDADVVRLSGVGAVLEGVWGERGAVEELDCRG